MVTSGTRLQYYSLYLVAFANSAGLIAITTLLPTYIDRLAPPGVVIGLFISGLTMAQAIAIVPFGWAGDKFDKRSVLVGSLVACACAYALFPFVESSAGFVAVRFLQGIGVVGVAVVGLALAGELSGADERANMIGRYNASRLAAGVLGTLGAGALFDRFGFHPVFGILVALFLLAVIGTWRYIRPDRSTVGFAFGELAVNRRILTLASFRTQYAFAVTLMRNWVAIYVGVSAAQGGLGFAAFVVGIVIAVERFTNMLCQPITGRLSDSYGRAMFVFVGGTCYGLLSIAFPFASTIGASLGGVEASAGLEPATAALIVIIGLNGLLGVADAFREPASMALFADEGTEQGGITSSFGIRGLLWRPGNVIAPIVGGVVMTQVGIEWVFFIAGFFALSGVVTFLGILTRAHGRRALAAW